MNEKIWLRQGSSVCYSENKNGDETRQKIFSSENNEKCYSRWWSYTRRTPEKEQERKEIDAQVRIGYSEVLEKGKDIRQKFFNTLINGTRNGNGKRVLETF